MQEFDEPGYTPMLRVRESRICAANSGGAAPPIYSSPHERKSILKYHTRVQVGSCFSVEHYEQAVALQPACSGSPFLYVAKETSQVQAL